MITFIAHRGNDSKTWIENSIQGLTHAIEKDYIDGVELDVRMTKDKKIVVIHGITISDSVNETKFISTSTLEELKKYDLDSSKKTLEIATLDEVLSKINIANNKKILIDIKEESIYYKTIVYQVHKILKRYHQLNFYICSFNYPLLKYWKQKYPKDKVGIIIGLLVNTDKFNTELDFISANKYHLKKCDFRKETFLWTVNNEKELLDIMNKTRNVGIITDRSKILSKSLKRNINYG